MVEAPGGGGGGGGGEQDGASWESSAELQAVEALPAAGTIGSLWREVMRSEGAAALVEDDVAARFRQLVGEADEAASRLRSHLPALLVGPEGAAAGTLADALASLPGGEAAGSAAVGAGEAAAAAAGLDASGSSTKVVASGPSAVVESVPKASSSVKWRQPTSLAVLTSMRRAPWTAGCAPRAERA